MKTYIAPVGFATERIIQTVASQGVGSDDELLLLRPANSEAKERTDRAIEDIESLLTKIEADFTISSTPIPLDTFEVTYWACESKIAEAINQRKTADTTTESEQKPTVYICLTGGARELLLPMYLSALTHAPYVNLLINGDTDQYDKPQSWPAPNILADVPTAATETFDHITTDWQSFPDILAALSISDTTLRRHVDQLEEHGFVETKREDKRYAKLTFLGEMNHTSSWTHIKEVDSRGP